MIVDARVAGQPNGGVEAREIDHPPGRHALRAVITAVVRAEVAAFEDRERRRRFARVLTTDEIQAGILAGKVDSGGRPAGGPVDLEAAMAVAIEAFEDGRFFVFVDDQQVESLDDEVEIVPLSRVRFVRLVALAGG